jgi:hypothetical protein
MPARGEIRRRGDKLGTPGQSVPRTGYPAASLVNPGPEVKTILDLGFMQDVSEVARDRRGVAELRETVA